MYSSRHINNLAKSKCMIQHKRIVYCVLCECAIFIEYVCVKYSGTVRDKQSCIIVVFVRKHVSRFERKLQDQEVLNQRVSQLLGLILDSQNPALREKKILTQNSSLRWKRNMSPNRVNCREQVMIFLIHLCTHMSHVIKQCTPICALLILEK